MEFIDKIITTTQKRILSNGLKVFFRRTLPSGIVSVQVWVRSGSIHEGEFLGGGISHYLEHMVFKGTEKFSSEEISRRVSSVGGNINAYTTFMRTVYTVDVPVEAVDVAFEILSQITQHPKLDSSDAACEKEVILREIAMCEDDPDTRLSDATFAEVFHVHPFRVPVIGRKDIFQSMGDAEVKTYFKKRYVPDLFSVVVAGDIDGDKVFTLAEKYFSAIPAKIPEEPFIPNEPEQHSPREITLYGNTQVLRGNVIWRIPGLGHNALPALRAWALMLGKGTSSFLWQELHEKRELVHALDASVWEANGNGLFWISYVGDSDCRKEIEDALQETIRKSIRSKITPEVLKKTVRQSIVGLVNSLRTTESAASMLGRECVEIGDSLASKKIIERLQKLTIEDIREVADKYLREEKRTTSAFEKTALTKKKHTNRAKKSATNISVTFPPFEEFRLSSGIRVLLQPISGYPKVALRASALAGGAFESEKTKGASALLATLMTLDAGSRSAKEVSEAIESIGGTFTEVSGNNSLSLVAETLSGDEKIAAEIIVSALFDPKFSSVNFSRERASQLAALRSGYDEIEEFARLALKKEFFGRHPLATHAYGTEKSLKTLALRDVSQLHARIILPENVVVAASGEFDRAALLAMLDTQFSSMLSRRKITADSRNFRSVFSPALPKKSRVVEVPSPVPAEQAIVQLAFPDVGYCDDRFLVGSLLEELLGGISSNLFLEIREKRGLAYFVGANRICAPTSGMFYLYAGTTKEKAETVLFEMEKEIQRLRSGNISAEEFDSAKTRLCVAQRVARQRATTRCGNAALNALYGLSVNLDVELEFRAAGLKIEDVVRFATDVLCAEKSLALIVK